MKRSVICAGILMMTLTTGIGAASATEYDPNPANRYPAYSEPFRDRALQSSGVSLERRDGASQQRGVTFQQVPTDYGSATDRASSPYRGF